jgi:hypothetical protein
MASDLLRERRTLSHAKHSRLLDALASIVCLSTPCQSCAMHRDAVRNPAAKSGFYKKGGVLPRSWGTPTVHLYCNHLFDDREHVQKKSTRVCRALQGAVPSPTVQAVHVVIGAMHCILVVMYSFKTALCAQGY